ncbi:MAG: hypothetical protein ACFFE4_23180 [Candidatus Thorarchaeota archaeon]
MQKLDLKICKNGRGSIGETQNEKALPMSLEEIHLQPIQELCSKLAVKFHFVLSLLPMTEEVKQRLRDNYNKIIKELYRRNEF